ncbi:MAG: amino acid adenylation domain-containing protein [Anaerolineae bacterium]|nr:amino acid adenylation domain-containing protein [Anaerolineae bacterium]
MNVVEFLSHLRALDIKLWADNDNLRYSAPAGALTPELRAELGRRKPEILAFLRQAETVALTDTSPIQPVSRDKLLPLSFGQERLWFLQQLQPESCAYNIPLAARLSGPLDREALEQSLRALIRRHQSLRTTFDIEGEYPVQVIQAATDYQLAVVDCTPAEAEQWMAEDARRPFDLAQGPLLRTKLFRLANQEHILYFNFHHIIFDGWSMDRFCHELSTLYQARTGDGTAEALPELPIQFADFAAWERQHFAEAGTQGLAYWRKKLGGELPVMQLPAGYPRSTEQRFRGEKYEFGLSQALTESLKKISQEQNVTLFMTLLAAFKVLLHRYSGQADILVGVPGANRMRREVENLIGFFVNTLVFRTDLSGQPNFLELLRRVREVTLEAQTYQDTPFDKLVAELHPERDLNRQPLFQVMFVLQPPTGEFGGLLRLPGLTATPLRMIDNDTTKFDLSLEMFESAAGLVGSFEYSAGLFSEEAIARMAGHLQTLLAGIVTDPHQSISLLPLLTDAERRQILVEWNDTAVFYPRDKCLHQLFEAQVERTPDNIAVVLPALDSERQADQQLSYQELNDKSNQLARRLQKLGVGPETLVGIYMTRSLEMVVGLLGILKAGGAYVPLDPAYPKERLAFMLNDIQTPVLLTQAHLLKTLPELTAQVICLDTGWPDITPEDTANPASGVTDENLAYVIYTSGSTGKPKGTLITHHTGCNHMFWMQDAFPLTEGDAVLQSSPFSFDASVCEFFAPLFNGARLVLAQPDGHKDSHYLVKVIMEQGITTLQLVPSLLGVLLEERDFKKCRSLKYVIPGGEPLPLEFIKKFYQQFSIDLYNTYGPTEATIDATFWLCDRELKQNAAAIGRPIANLQTYILDAQLQPLPVGAPGELHIGGGLARGYLNRPDLTAEKFIPHPFSDRPGARLYKTGDIARYWPDGNIEYLDRLDHQVKLRGFRIELGEIEALLNRHQAIKQAVVMLREDNESDSRLAAYVVFQQHSSLSANELRHYLAQYLPDYMLPSVFVPLDAFPLGASGKIDQRALPVPEAISAEPKNYVAPRSPVEKLLANIWAETLGLKNVGVYDDFFELGGHSLLVTQLILRVRQMFQIDLPIREFFQGATVAGLAETIRAIRNHANIIGREVDLEAEAVLDAAIQPKTPGVATAPADAAAPVSIFLTGATGFLGAFLLFELLRQTQADIYCLVRADNVEDGYRRIQTNLEICRLWEEKFKPRIKPVAGNLAEPCLGLSPPQFAQLARQIDLIYHCAAYTNLVYPYHKLKPINVLGLQEILRLAVQDKTIPVHYVSTLAVFSAVDYFKGGVVYETDELQHSDTLFNGYCRSKWVAEQLVSIARARGVPVSVYRPGSIVGHSATGVWKTGDYLSRLIKVCLQLGRMPVPDGAWHLTPVDYVSQAIVYLSRQANSGANVFHLNSPHLLSTTEFCNLIQRLGYSVQADSYASWQIELLKLSRHDSNHALYSLLPIFLEPVSTLEKTTIVEMYTLDKEPRYDSRNVEERLAGTGLVCPPVDQALLSTYFSYWLETGFLP